MSLRIPRPSHALLAWAAVVTVGGVGSGYSRVRSPLLARHQASFSSETWFERTLLVRRRDEAVDHRNLALQREWIASLADSMPTPETSVAFDVQLPDRTAEQPARGLLEAYWKAHAARAAAAPVTIAIRAALPGRPINAETAISRGACRAVVFVVPWVHPSGRVRYGPDARDLDATLGLCLLTARYGVPGAAARSLIDRLNYPSRSPCFVGESAVATYRCRDQLRTGPAMQTTTRAVVWFGNGGGVRLACGARRPGACDAWTEYVLGGDVAPRNTRWDRSWFLPALELDLQPARFAQFWKDGRSTSVAYEAAAGRPFNDLLAELAVPTFAHYAPGPGVGLGAAAMVLLAIAACVGGAMLAFGRRVAASG